MAVALAHVMYLTYFANEPSYRFILVRPDGESVGTLNCKTGCEA